MEAARALDPGVRAPVGQQLGAVTPASAAILHRSRMRESRDLGHREPHSSHFAGNDQTRGRGRASSTTVALLRCDRVYSSQGVAMARDVHRIIDEQIAKWRTERQRQDKVSATDPDRPRPRVVTIANPLGANGSPIGARVGELLGIPAYDREIVQHIADTAHVSVSAVETLDERARGRLEEYMTALLTQHTFNASDHLRALTRTVLALWEHGPCVLTGHGCVHILPRDHALTVRITAAEELRIQRVAASQGVAEPEARRLVRASDAEREAFHRRYFGVAADDLQLYDLVVSSGLLDDQGCAEIIAAAYRARFALRR